MKITRKTIPKILIAVFAVAMSLCSGLKSYADNSFSVSPMNQKIILIPGEIYQGSFKLTNPVTSNNDFSYTTKITPFYMTDDNQPDYQSSSDYNQMVNWITVKNPEGVVAPNITVDINFTIKVPKDAPAGGQYATITVASNPNDSLQENAINIQAKYSIAHIIYAEVSGITKRSGEIIDASVPSFLLDGDISGTSSVKNTGNVHDVATYTLQVYPLFSSEEVFTNEEDPIKKTVMPDRILTNITAWEDTPIFGIFNVVYTVEFQGVTTQVSKMVIKCPLWLLFIIILVVVALIVWIVIRIKMRKKSQDE